MSPERRGPPASPVCALRWSAISSWPRSQARPDDEVETFGIRQLMGRFPRLGVGDLKVSQGHDGSSSEGLARTIKKTIKVDGLSPAPAGSARIVAGDSHRKSAV